MGILFLLIILLTSVITLYGCWVYYSSIRASAEEIEENINPIIYAVMGFMLFYHLIDSLLLFRVGGKVTAFICFLIAAAITIVFGGYIVVGCEAKKCNAAFGICIVTIWEMFLSAVEALKPNLARLGILIIVFAVITIVFWCITMVKSGEKKEETANEA